MDVENVRVALDAADLQHIITDVAGAADLLFAGSINLTEIADETTSDKLHASLAYLHQSEEALERAGEQLARANENLQSYLATLGLSEAASIKGTQSDESVGTFIEVEGLGSGFLEIGDLSEKIAEGLIDGTLEPADIERLLREHPTIRSAYPTFEVPAAFVARHPNILFEGMPMKRFNQFRHRPDGTIEYTFDNTRTLLQELGIDKMPTLNMADLVSRLQAVNEQLSGKVAPYPYKLALMFLTQSFVKNLELHRLTRDPTGRLVRFTTTPEEDLDVKDLASLDEFPPYMHATTPVPFRNLFKHKHVAFWWRFDARNSERYPRRHMIESTVGEQEQNHYIVLDASEICALMCVKK